MAYNEKLQKRIAKRIVKTPRTASEIAQLEGYRDGRGIAKILARIVKTDKSVRRNQSRPPTYQRV